MPNDRYGLAAAMDTLRAQLAKAERHLPLSQPVRSSHLYAEAITIIESMTDEVRAAVAKANDR